MSWKTTCTTRDERVTADRRQTRIAWLGMLVTDVHRVHKIAAKLSPSVVGHGSPVRDAACPVCKALKARAA